MMSTIVDTRNPGQPLFVDCQGDLNIAYHGEGSIQIKSPPISDEEVNDDDYAYAKEEPEDQIDIDDKSHICTTEIQDDSLSSKVTTDVSNDSSMDTVQENPAMNIVPTVMVPVIDPETKIIKNTVVPVEMIDDTGMNIIKSVLIPMITQDGKACYEVKKVLVPIPPRPSLPVGKPVLLAPSLSTKIVIPPLPRLPEKAPKKPPQSCLVKMLNQPRLSLPGKTSTQSAPSSAVQAPPKFRMPETEPAKLPIERLAKSTSNLPDNPTTNPTSSNKVRQILPKLTSTETVEDSCLVEAEDQLEEDPLKDKKIADDDLDAMDKMLDDLQSTSPLSFNTQQEMDTHSRRDHKKQFLCNQCYLRYDSPEALKDHKKIHGKETYVQCNLCHRKYKRMRELIAHRFRKHATEDPRSMHDLIPEESLPNINPENPDNTWGQRHQLLGKSYSCNKCNKVYLRRYLLNAHERIAHNIQAVDNSKLYQCKICDKTFENWKQYNKHNITHSKGRYQCDLCNKKLQTKFSLKQHLMRHNDERSFECSTCDKRFITKDSLKCHELIHTGLKPYICDICGQTFNHRKKMRTHRKKHPGNHPPPPRVKLVNIEKL